MTELTQKQKQKLLAAAEIVQEGDMAVLKNILEMKDFVEQKEESITKLSEDVKKEVSDFKEEASATLEKISAIEQGKDGEDGKPGRDGKNGKDGRDGRDGRDGTDGKDGESIVGTAGKDGSPDTGENIVQKINDLPVEDEEFKIEVSHIKGMDALMKDVRTIKNRPSGGGIVGRDLIQDIDISDQLNGVLKTFNIPAVWRIISVDLSSFPYGSCRKNIDYTWTPQTITFTSAIDASTQLATGQTCILTVVTG